MRVQEVAKVLLTTSFKSDQNLFLTKETRQPTPLLFALYSDGKARDNETNASVLGEAQSNSSRYEDLKLGKVVRNYLNSTVSNCFLVLRNKLY